MHDEGGGPFRRSLAPLDDPACPVCAAICEERERYRFWFYAEAARQPETLHALAASRGFCAVHARMLFADHRAGEVLPAVLAACLSAHRARLEAERSAPLTACPACAKQDWFARQAAAAKLASSAAAGVEPSRRPGPICPAHVPVAIAAVDPLAACRLASLIAQELRSPLRVALLERAAVRADPDFPFRCRLPGPAPRERGEEGSPDRSGLHAVLGDLAVGGCPACASGERAVRRYLAWVGVQADPRSLAGEEAPYCTAHLSDLRVVAPPAASEALGAMVSALASDLEFASERLRLLVAGHLSGRLGRMRRLRGAGGVGRSVAGLGAALGAEPFFAALLRSRRSLICEVIGSVTRARRCPACAQRSLAEQRSVKVLLAAFAAPSVLRRYGESHGLCLRHVLACSPASQHPVVRGELAARLGVAAFELGEIDRRRLWSARHEQALEPTRLVADALARLDGRVFLGGSPPSAGGGRCR
ncbi:MAG TPA: hypothetical protein VMD59_16745 [Acidimicrobiales bacterium]|nr:hypothetical protein [Acidimicrobiales bacterium]